MDDFDPENVNSEVRTFARQSYFSGQRKVDFLVAFVSSVTSLDDPFQRIATTPVMLSSPIALVALILIRRRILIKMRSYQVGNELE